MQFLGMRDDIPKLMAAMDIVVLASYAEGIPRVLLEAAAMGKPAVGTDVRGTREVIIDGETGYLVPSRDAPALADAISRLSANPARRREMGKAARRRAKAHFDERFYFWRTDHEYRRLIEAKLSAAHLQGLKRLPLETQQVPAHSYRGRSLSSWRLDRQDRQPRATISYDANGGGMEVRCTKCVLTDNTPNIVFDEAGVCNYCHTYQKFQYKGEAELLRTLDSFRRPDSKYDCLVGVSGGKDSSYLLLTLVKDYRMKVLAVNYENPFTVPQARINIDNAIKALNIDIVRFQDKNNSHRKVFRNTVTAWFRRPSPALIPIVCIGCKPAWIEIYRIAKRYDIHCIASGGNPFEVISFKREMVGISRDEDPRRAFFKYIYSLREILENPAYLDPRIVLTLIKSYLFGSPYSIGIRLSWPNIKWVELFNYIEWNEQEILSRIKAELDWDSPPELISTWRFDCRVKHLVDFMYMNTLNMTDKDDFYAKMVREGLMTRENALQRLQNEAKPYIDEIQLLLDQAGIRDASFLHKLHRVSDA